MKKKNDWTAPHWEAVAAEQLLIDSTVGMRNGRAVVIRSPHGGRARLRHPETNKPLLSTGDVGHSGPHRVGRLWFAGAWHVIPSHADAMRWTLDGMAETPDGREVEPDDPDSWLILCGLV